MSWIKILRFVALVEATSFLVLLVATYVKYANDSPGGVSIMGPVHGVLFLAYVVIAPNARGPARWSNRTTLVVLLGAVVPLGGFIVDWWLAKRAPTRVVQSHHR